MVQETMIDSVSIGIKTFLRDDKLFRTIRDIRATMPEVKMIIADDGEHTEEKDGVYADLIRDGHEVILLPFDSGFGMKSNRIAAACATPYLLIGSDDFDFAPPSVRAGIEALADVLGRTNVDIASGRVGQHGAYEFLLTEKDGVVTEYCISGSPDMWYVPCDLTVNYSLIRTSILERGKIYWDDDVKIGGGEHGAFFVDVKRAGYRVAYVPGVVINEQTGLDSARYRQYRARSNDAARPCFDRRGIRKYVLGSGYVDYEAAF